MVLNFYNNYFVSNEEISFCIDNYVCIDNYEVIYIVEFKFVIYF